MNLNAEQFAEALHTLQQGEGAAPAAGAEHEKRRATRVSHRGRASIALGDDPRSEVSTTVVIKDLSPRGVGIVHSQRLRRGSNFVLRLSRDEGQAPIAILCTVAHCRQVEKSLFTIGAEFTCVIGDGQLPSAPGRAADDLERIRRSVLD